jgi:hypothetical protein
MLRGAPLAGHGNLPRRNSTLGNRQSPVWSKVLTGEPDAVIPQVRFGRGSGSNPLLPHPSSNCIVTAQGYSFRPVSVPPIDHRLVPGVGHPQGDGAAAPRPWLLTAQEIEPEPPFYPSLQPAPNESFSKPPFRSYLTNSSDCLSSNHSGRPPEWGKPVF